MENITLEKNENGFYKNGNNENETFEKIENNKNENETYMKDSKDENGEDEISKLNNDNSIENINKSITKINSNKKEKIDLDNHNNKYNENKNEIFIKKESNENQNEDENELFKETELIRIESSPIEINDENYVKKNSNKQKINFIINKSNLFNQLISTEIIKEKKEENKNNNIIQNVINKNDINSEKDNSIRNSKYDSKFILKRLEQINEDNNNYIDQIKISISKESAPNKINISKNIKFHDSLNSTLYELMDEPSYSMINIKFPQIKPIMFKQKDFNFIKSQKDIKSI